jgi:imidazole glycerol-phosphate synthase subunit HisF
LNQIDIIPRIIPSLLLKGKGLYKGKSFKNHRYIGDPINAVKIFNDKKADELLFFDIEATDRGVININLIKEIAGECFMPFAYGGGVKTLEDINALIRAGAEKVIINTEGIKNKLFLKEAVKEFGSSSIVFCLDYKTDIFGRKRVYINSGKEKTNWNPKDWIKALNDMEVGEIVINSIDREGSRLGFDFQFFKSLIEISKAPLIISGGCKDFDEIKKAINEHNISGLSAGSCFVFQGKHDAVLISYPELNY